MKITGSQLVKKYGERSILKGVTFEAEFDHALVLVGPSGGGKSTLLRMLAGLIAPDAGQLAVNGRELIFSEEALAGYRRKIGIVFQAANLFPHLTAYENVLLPLEKVHGFADAKERALEALERFRLGEHAGKHPAQLSGGERQRVAIARAIAIEPEFVIMDEPTSALDPEMTGEVLDMIAELRDAGAPLIQATHEMGFARQVADVVAFVSQGQVKILPKEEFFSEEAGPEVKQFLSRILRY